MGNSLTTEFSCTSPIETPLSFHLCFAMSIEPPLAPSPDGSVGVGSPAYYRINLALFCAGFITFVTLYDVQPLLPLFAESFGVSPALSSLPLSLATTSLAVGMLFAGTLSESLGRRRTILFALLITSLLALATGLCRSFEALLTLRLLQGMALAGVPSVAMAYLGEEMDNKALGSAMGLYISGNAFGGMSGRIGSALLCDHFKWSSAIAIIGGLSLILTLVSWFALPPQKGNTLRPFRAAYLLSSLGRQLQNRALLCLYALAFLCMGGFVSLYNYIGFRLMALHYSLPAATVSLIFLVYLLGSFSSGMVGRLTHRFPLASLLNLTLLAMFIGTLVTLFTPLPLIVFGVAGVTCGFFGAHALASSWVGRLAGNGKAQAASLYLFCYYQGSSLSGTLGGLFWEHAGWPGTAGMIATLLMIALVVASKLKLLTS